MDLTAGAAPLTVTSPALAEGEVITIAITDEGTIIDLWNPAGNADGPTHTESATWDDIAERLMAPFEPDLDGASPSPSIIPPAAERPVCVTVEWLAEHPSLAAKLEYLDHNYRHGEPAVWQPAADAIHTIDPGWPVEVREVRR